jgi:hypothetical protein
MQQKLPSEGVIGYTLHIIHILSFNILVKIAYRSIHIIFLIWIEQDLCNNIKELIKALYILLLGVEL